MSEPVSTLPPPSSPPPRRGGRRIAVVAPVATAAAVAVVASGVLLLQRQSGSGAGYRPPVLHLVGTSAVVQADQAAKAPADAAPAGGSGPRVEGSLPDGPDRARVRTFAAGSAPREAVARLAGALGLSGTPVRRGDGWTVEGSGGMALRVTDGSGWRWALGTGVAADQPTMSCHVIVGGKRACPPDLPVGAPVAPPAVPGPPGKVVPIEPPVVDQPNGGSGSGPGAGSGAEPGSNVGSVGSASASAGSAGSAGSGGSAGSAGSVGVPAPVDPPAQAGPSAAAVRKAAAPVLAGLGLGGASVRVDSYPALGLLSAAPVVDGLPTLGYETHLSYDLRVRLTGGSGWLGTPTAGAEYPLVSARKAVERMPVPAVAIAKLPCTDSEPSRCQPVQTVITGARLGLLLSWDETGTALLVPAWLYDVRGWSTPWPVIAVDRAYLAPSAGQGQSGPAQSEPAQSEPAPSRASDVPTKIAPATPVTGTRLPPVGGGTGGGGVPIPASPTR